MREVRQAGGAGVLGAVACRVQPEGARERWSTKKSKDMTGPLNQELVAPTIPDILLCWLA